MQNTRKKRPSDQPCGPPAKRGRPRIDPLLDRYPPYSPNAESEDEVHEQAMKDELDGAKRKDVIVPHLRASFASRRDFILSNEESNGFDDIVSRYPALKLPYAISCR